MRKMACLLLLTLFLLSGCSHSTAFTELENGNLMSPDGVEYTLSGTEPEVYYLGTLTFEAGVRGEETYNYRGRAGSGSALVLDVLQRSGVFGVH